MRMSILLRAAVVLAGAPALMIFSDISSTAFAQAQPAAMADQAAAVEQGPQLLTAGELDVLVARIALYPDDLVALISTASIYPLQIVDAARFLEAVQTSPDLKPKESWDGSVISLLNYPDIVKMMSDDLEWTQAFGDAIANQPEDVLAAIQHLRDNAMTTGSIQSDDKMQVVRQGSNVVIQPTNPDSVYIPQYEPAMLYDPGYRAAPIAYYPRAYPSYYHPVAPYFAGFVTGVAFAAVVDWDHHGVWGGRWDGGDIDIDCNHCFNDRDFNGKVKFNDVDWKNVDRNKINVDKNQINNVDRTKIKNNIEANGNNNVKKRAADAGKTGKNGGARKAGDAGKAADARNGAGKGAGDNRPGGQKSNAGAGNGGGSGGKKSTAATNNNGKGKKSTAATNTQRGGKKSTATDGGQRGGKKSTGAANNNRSGKADRSASKGKQGQGANKQGQGGKKAQGNERGKSKSKSKSRKSGGSGACVGKKCDNGGGNRRR